MNVEALRLNEFGLSLERLQNSERDESLDCLPPHDLGGLAFASSCWCWECNARASAIDGKCGDPFFVTKRQR